MNSPLRVHVEHPALPEVPIEKWLTAKQVAAHFGLSASSAYRWAAEGRIPERFICYRGMHQYLFHPDLLLHLKKLFNEAHE